ncbi:MAG: azurin [Rudaea sp.]
MNVHYPVPLRTLVLLSALMISGLVQAENCSIDLKAGDAIKFDRQSITVDATCKKITINLTHTGKLPAATMGHNVVIAPTDAFQSVAQDGMVAGLAGDYVKAGDSRVIAHTKIIGGGETATASFTGNKLKAGGAYTFFCSAPGHWSLMHGQLVVK